MSWAADLIRAQDGDVIVIPLALARALGLPAAAFLRQAAYLSAILADSKEEGWFFLEQEGQGNPCGETIFQRLGSWQHALGLGPRAQASIRQQLIGIGLLEEKRGGMVHGKLRYRVDAHKYLTFLAQCGRATHCFNAQPAKSDCANAEERLHNQQGAGCTNRAASVDIYEVELGSGIKKQQHAQHAPEVRAALGDAAADSNEQKRRHPRRTANRIECWYPSDDTPANDIEALFPAEQVAAAVAAVKARPNSVGKPTSPVPARVAEELERAQRAAEAAERHAGHAAKRAAEAQSILPPDILRQRSAALLAAVRTGRFNTHTQEATA